MGAMASSCTLLKTETTTKLFTVPDYSKWARMPAGTALKYNKFWHGYGRCRLKVYPAGFDEELAGYVAIFVAVTRFGGLGFNKGVRVVIEILDVGADNHTARSEQTLVDNEGRKGYVLFIKRTTLQEAVRAKDTFTVRCTISVDETKKLTSPRGPPAEDRPKEDMCVPQHNEHDVLL